jgi:membrane protein
MGKAPDTGSLSKYPIAGIIRRHVRRATTLGGLGFKDLAIRVLKRAEKDDLLGRAGQLSYFFVLSLFPFAIFLSMLLGYFFAADQDKYFSLLLYLNDVMPGPAFQLVRHTLDEVTAQANAGVLTIGFALSIWVASSGMTAIIEGLNVAYSVSEARPWWKQRLVAIALTGALLFLATGAFFVIVAGEGVIERLSTLFPVISEVAGLSDLVQWTLGILFILLFLALLFRFAPNLRHPRWEANFPGAVLTLVCWLIASGTFKLYLSRFGSYNLTYGSMEAAILLLVWLYVSGAALLLGGELNSVIWHAIVQQRKKKLDYALMSP